MFKDLQQNRSITLQEAVNNGSIHPQSAVFTDPYTHKSYNLRDATDRLLLEPTGHYTDRTTKVKLTIAQLLSNRWLVAKEAATISETKQVVIRSALDPRTDSFVDVDTAVKRGLLDTDLGTYTQPISGEQMSIQTAIDAGYLQTSGDGDDDVDFATNKAIKETRSFTITGAIDPPSGQRIDVATALQRGIIDQANGQYVGRDAFGRERRMPIGEAIKAGLIFATSTGVRTDVTTTDSQPKYVQETQTFTIKSVVDPRSKKPISVSEAIAKGILDQGKGQYVNTVTGAAMAITDAITKGLVSADVSTRQQETEVAEPDSRIMSQRQVTCTIIEVRHPNTGASFVWFEAHCSI